MLRNITIGQHYPIESKIHNLDPRIKIVITLIFIVSLFIVNSYKAYLIVLVFLFIAILLSRIPIELIIKGLKPILFIIIFTFIINTFLTPGHVFLSIGPIKVTYEGLYQAGFMALRLIMLIMGTSLLTLTTSPILLTDGIEYLFNPLKKIGFPAHELAMMMTIALRFIPTLIEETEKIMKAQKSRGADFESGHLIKRAKSLVPLLVPLFVSAFRRADDLAMAMEARCYRGGINRTRMRKLEIKSGDYIAAIFTGIYLTVLIYIRISW